MNVFRLFVVAFFALCLSESFAQPASPKTDSYDLFNPIVEKKSKPEVFSPIVDSAAVREAQAVMDSVKRAARRAKLAPKVENPNGEGANKPKASRKVTSSSSSLSSSSLAPRSSSSSAVVQKERKVQKEQKAPKAQKEQKNVMDSAAVLPAVAPADTSPCGKLGDNEICDLRDNARYETVTIGSQTWFKRNLAYKAEGSYCPEDSEEKCNSYGRLYLWASANSCPDGWTLPDVSDFETLYNYVMSQLKGSEGVGTSLKNIVGWAVDEDDDIQSGTNRFGFGAKPAGYRDSDGSYMSIGEEANFWTTKEIPEEDRAIYWNLYYENQDFIGSYEGKKSAAMSVRCIKK